MNVALNLTVQQIPAHTRAPRVEVWRELKDRYFETKPCKHCGDTRRYKSNKRCVNCHAQAAALKWAAANHKKGTAK